MLRLKKLVGSPLAIGRVFSEYVFMGFVLLTCTLPIIWVFISSFKNNMEVLESPLSWPSHISLESYIDAFKVAKLQVFFVNSVVVAVIATLIALIIYSMAAYAVARFKFKFKGLIFVLFSASLLIPVNSMIYPIYYLIKSAGLYDTKAALVVVYIGIGLPISFFILRSYFINIPIEIEESAYIDGANIIKMFFKIIFPIAKPAIASAAIMIFLGCWNDFLFALLLTSSEKNRTLPLSLKYFVINFSYDYPSLFATVVMILIPCILVYVLLQEQIMESLVAGSVKG